MIQNREIAKVGGGLGGLTLARLLQMKGCNVKIYKKEILTKYGFTRISTRLT
ncbi:phytoene dehydrogenase-like protein [Pedobacter sp. UYP30]|uniref:NAD(P)-binding protein n=1 Tax=Pedobacter sp. UYP30 TaxID=1756400 RepID=UPI0033919BDB